MTSNFQQNLINFSACSHEGVFVFFGDMFADALRDALWRPYVCIVCVFHLRVDILHTSCCPVVLLLLLAHRYERQAASRKQDGIQAEFAKGHMPFQVYAVLTEETAKLTPSSAWGNVLALWAFMVLCFSLFCRGHNTAMITFGCLSVHQEALLLDFCKTKCNQNGLKDERRNIMPNPFNPAVCPVLALAVAIATFSNTTGRITDKIFLGACVGGCNHFFFCQFTQCPLFLYSSHHCVCGVFCPCCPGGGYETTFGHKLRDLVEKLPKVVEVMTKCAISPQDLGVHSLRKVGVCVRSDLINCALCRHALAVCTVAFHAPTTHACRHDCCSGRAGLRT